MAAAMDVDPDVLLFTQDSVGRKFRPPHQDQRIDDAVDSILGGKKAASEFPKLEVVVHEGRLWCHDNRRLWVFRKARVPIITVKLVPYKHHPRFADLMENKPELKLRLLEKGYWPLVRGRCRKKFSKPDGNYARPPPPSPRPVVVEATAYGTGSRIKPIRIKWQVVAKVPKPDGNYVHLPPPPPPPPPPPRPSVVEAIVCGTGGRIHPISVPKWQVVAKVPKPDGNYVRQPPPPPPPPPRSSVVEAIVCGTGGRIHPISIPERQVLENFSKPNGNFSRPPPPPPLTRPVFVVANTGYGTGARVHPISIPQRQAAGSRSNPHVSIDLGEPAMESGRKTRNFLVLLVFVVAVIVCIHVLVLTAS